MRFKSIATHQNRHTVALFKSLAFIKCNDIDAVSDFLWLSILYVTSNHIHNFYFIKSYLLLKLTFCTVYRDFLIVFVSNEFNITILWLQLLQQKLETSFYSGQFSWEEVNPNDAAALLKKFIRELPSPLLTSEYVNTFSAVRGRTTMFHMNTSSNTAIAATFKVVSLLRPDWY